jgi:uncharacterized protein (TIGR03118 family)
MQRRHLLLAGGAGALLTACGGGDDDAPNAYHQTNLVADSASAATFRPTAGTTRAAEFLNAWGIAIRPAGAGGHFWVAAGGYSYQFVGDVKASADAALHRLSQDALAIVRIPGAGVADGDPAVSDPEHFEGFTTGVAFNGAALTSDRFPVRDQPVTVDGVPHRLSGSARFVFCTDSGVISAWTERDAADGSIVRRDGDAVAVIDGRDQGHAYFGLAIRPGSWDLLWAADFGADPQLRAWDAQWRPVALGERFANPFLGGRPRAQPGDFVPFNVQVLEWNGVPHLFVAYAKSRPDPADSSRFLAAEEDALARADEGERPARGRVAMFDLDGRLVRAFADDGRLNAPWGLAIAPAEFGRFRGALLVGNFGGAGRIAAFELASGRFLDYLKRPDGRRLEIEGLWGLQFGNGASLGDRDALYFAAGPADETQGLFGVLRAA